MNTISGFEDRSLEKELESAHARIAFLESKLQSEHPCKLKSPDLSSSRQQSDHYLPLIDDIDQGVLVLDCSFNVVLVNRSALLLTEKDRESFDVLEIYQSMDQVDKLRISKILSDLKSSRAPDFYELELQLPSAKKKVLLLKFKAIFSPMDDYEGVQIIMTNVTAEHKVRQALEHSETMYRALFDGAGDAIFIHAYDGRFIDANRLACERLGYSREELLKLSPCAIRADGNYISFAEHGRSEVFEEVEHITSTGEKFAVEVNSRLVLLDGEKSVLTIARDISERVEADKRAVLNRKRLKTLYEMAHMNETSTEVFFEFAMRRSLELSESEFGFIAQLEGHGSTAWFSNWICVSKYEEQGALRVPDNLSQCGGWSAAVTRRASFYSNFVEASEDHFPFPKGGVRNFLALPVLEAGRVVAVAVLANRAGGYENDNVRNLALLLEGMWNIRCKKKSEQRVRHSLREKETLLKEVHHRVKNNMQVICSLLNLQTEYINDPQDLVLIRHSIDRVRSMAYVHEQLYRSDDLSSIDFGHYISALGLKLISSHGVANKIGFETRLESILLPIEQALPCGLIVNELITNAIEHAFPEERAEASNKISVRLSLDGKAVKMSVADNGIGFKDGLERSGSLGHVLIDTLVQQIEGSLDSLSEGGSRFELNFRLK